MHNDYAYNYSPILKAAFECNFCEGQTQEYRLQDIAPLAVLLLNHCLYTQGLDVKCADSDKAAQVVHSWKQFDPLIEVWVLADKLLIPSCRTWL